LLATLLGAVALLLWGIRMMRTGMMRAFGGAALFAQPRVAEPGTDAQQLQSSRGRQIRLLDDADDLELLAAEAPNSSIRIHDHAFF